MVDPNLDLLCLNSQLLKFIFGAIGIHFTSSVSALACFCMDLLLLVMVHFYIGNAPLQGTLLLNDWVF